MRALAAALVFVGFAAGPLLASVQDGRARPAGRGVRFPVQTSDLLTHSLLGACNVENAPTGFAPERAHIATWNIRAARSAPVEAIAAEVQAMQADVIALQEVDIRTRRSGFVDQPSALANLLGFHYAFAASIKWDEGDYGLAVLSRWPFTEVRRHRLDATDAGEPRIVLEVTICRDGRPLRLFDHHADGRVVSRDNGFAALEEIVRPGAGPGVLVMGDFNEPPEAPNVRRLVGAGLIDLGGESHAKTTDGGRIDYLMADAPIARRTSNVRVWPTEKSDHHAVLADLDW